MKVNLRTPQPLSAPGPVRAKAGLLTRRAAACAHSPFNSVRCEGSLRTGFSSLVAAPGDGRAPAAFLGQSFPNLARFKGLLAVLVGLPLLPGCHRPASEPKPQPPELPTATVRTVTVEAKPTTSLEEVVGTIRATRHATIEAKTSGRIAELRAVLGQKIKSGELLVRLDAPEIKARLDQAEAGFLQAEREWKRVTSLFGQQAATQADYDGAEGRYQQARGAVAEAKAMASYVEIRAPFDGVVTRKWADVGDLAAPGKQLIDIEDPSRLQLEADVPEAISARIQQDSRMSVRLNGNGSELQATVAEIAPVADPNSRTLRVKLDLPGGPGLMSGQFARLLVPTGEADSLGIPASSVVVRGQMEIVFAVENGRAHLRLVKTGRRLNDEIEILSGLAAGDAVVVENAQNLVDGQAVQGK